MYIILYSLLLAYSMKPMIEQIWIPIVSGEVFEKLEHAVFAALNYLMNEISMSPILFMEKIT